jgi:hypothetical protein
MLPGATSSCVCSTNSPEERFSKDTGLRRRELADKHVSTGDSPFLKAEKGQAARLAPDFIMFQGCSKSGFTDTRDGPYAQENKRDSGMEKS